MDDSEWSRDVVTDRTGGPKGRRGGEPNRVGDVLGGIFERLGISEGIARQDAIHRWGEVVGERIAAVTHPSSISGDVLFVKVASSAWLTELNLMRHDILSRLNAGRKEGRVERIVFTLWERPPGDPGGGATGSEEVP